MHARRLVVMLLLALLALGCPGKAPSVARPQPTAAVEPPSIPVDPVVWKESLSGLGFRLTEASEPALPPAADVRKATDEETRALLARMEPLPDVAGGTVSVALRDASLKPPRAGETISESFPPASGPPPARVVSSGAFKVLRHAPDGEVAMAPRLSVTFSEAMVPLTSLSELARAAVPVKLTPEVPGRWRWLGTQTLVFEPEGERFPMATEYKVEIPAGTKSASGAALAAAESWTFSTPTPSLQARAPSGSQEIWPVLFASFDQKIDPAEVLKTTRVLSGKEELEIRLAERAEIEADENVRTLVEREERAAKEHPRVAGRWMAFRTTKTLPEDSYIEVSFDKGTKSAEGPRTTEKPHTFGFRSLGPMKFISADCHWDDICPPLNPWSLSFTNSIDQTKFDPSMIRISPPIQDMKIDASGSTIHVRGRTRGQTTYKIEIDGAIRDGFGQALGKTETAEIMVDSAEPMLIRNDQEMVLIDPAQGANLPVFSINYPKLQAKLYAVTPEDLEKFDDWIRDQDWGEMKLNPPGKLVSTKILQTQKAPDELVETNVDLSPALKGGYGQVVAVVEPYPVKVRKNRWDQRQWVRAWVQVTSMGLVEEDDGAQLVGWATSLKDGSDIEGARVSVLGNNSVLPEATGKDGVARLTLAEGARQSNAVLLQRGDDLTFLRRGVGQNSLPTDGYRWLTFTDRGLYKPKEEVRLKGWLRLDSHGKNAGLSLPSSLVGKEISYRVNDPRGSEIAKGKTQLDSGAGFDIAFTLPDASNLGSARISLTLEDGSRQYSRHHTEYFQVQEFRAPEFDVAVQATGEPVFVGGHAETTLAAKYYSGGGLPGAEVSWRVNRSEGVFTPPEQPGYVFGKHEQRSWWVSQRDRRPSSESLKSRTDASGEHKIRIDMEALDPSFPMSLLVRGSVTDVNRQEWSGSTTILVHPASVYVGLRVDAGYVKQGDAIPLDVLVTGIDGRPVAGRSVVVKAGRIDWVQKGDSIEEKVIDPVSCDVVSVGGPSRCALATKEPGRYRISAVVRDEFGRRNQSTSDIWVMGDSVMDERSVRPGSLDLVADRTSYSPGDTAEILVMAPFAPSEGLLTVAREGIVVSERVHLTTRSSRLKVQIPQGAIPNLEVKLELVGMGKNPRGGQGSLRPAVVHRDVSLAVPARERTLTIAAKAREREVDPGSKTVVDLEVTDAKGAPVPGAEIAFVAADEAILALGGVKTPDPIAHFYPARPAGYGGDSTQGLLLVGPDMSSVSLEGKMSPAKAAKRKAEASREAIGLGSIGTIGHGSGKGSGQGFGSGSGRLGVSHKSKEVRMGGAPAPEAPMLKKAEDKAKPSATATAAASGGNEGGESKEIKVRKRFDALAAFAPRVVADSSGKASVPVELPDSLTRFRLMAVATAGENRFGAGESSITVRLPLMVRPSAPRFLNFGDRFDLPIVVQNQSDRPMDVLLAARSRNAILTEGAGRRVTVPAKNRVEVRLPSSTDASGKARFQFAVAAGDYADSAQIEVPVWTPLTTEAFATYGQIDDAARAIPIKTPPDVIRSVGGLEIQTSSTALQALTDAVLYIAKYPYGCNEQISSRILGVAALRDVLEAFHAEGLPPAKELEAGVLRDAEKLKSRRHWTGGWGFWGGDREPYPYVSIFATHALVVSNKKGLTHDRGYLAESLEYLSHIEKRLDNRYYSIDAKRTMIAYALYVRWLAGKSDVKRAKKLIDEAGGAGKLPIDAMGWLLPIVAADKDGQKETDALMKAIGNRVVETAGAANFESSYGDSGHLLLHSSRRTDAIVLSSLLEVDPKSELIPKIVAGLLGHRKAGHWSNTQENVFVLLALDRYFHQVEGVTPDFVARAWLGDKSAFEHKFQGRTTERAEVDIPMSLLPAPGQSSTLTVAKEGPGRMYYRLAMSYAPADLRPPPMDQGFVLSRYYEAAENPSDVRRDSDGTWHVRAGAKVKVHVGMTTLTRRYHVALVDPLPAGFEPINTALAGTAPLPEEKAKEKSGMPWWWQRTWYEHQQMRDERVEAFSSLLWEGEYEYTYFARATTPGTFVAPASRAEEMYSPEVFGRGESSNVIVE